MKTKRNNRVITVAFSFILACVCLTYSCIGYGQNSCIKDANNIFDTLQDNAWYLQTSDGKSNLYVTSLGAGPSVIVLHGGPGDDFQYLVDAVKPLRSKYRFVLFDQRGSLLSPVSNKEIDHLSLMQIVDDLEQIRSTLNISKVILLGHSMGSLVAELYFQKYPEHVAGLILTGSMPPSIGTSGLSQLMDKINQRAKILTNRRIVDEQVQLLEKNYKNESKSYLESEKRKIYYASVNLVHIPRWVKIQGGGVYYNSAVGNVIGNTVPSHYSILPILKKYPVPTYLIQGDQDYVDPSASAWRVAAKNMKNIHVLVVPDSGHMSWIDNPRVFNEDLGESLTAISRNNEINH